MTDRTKLLEVALPLEAINMESAREKSIRHGHPSTLHLWWARRPLAACRAVLWSSLVDDPSSWPERFPTEEDQTRERQRLFDILGRITMKTDRRGNTKQVEREYIAKYAPPVYAPFAGGGSIPLDIRWVPLRSG